MSETTATRVTSVRRLVDVQIVIDPPRHLSWGCQGDLEKIAKAAEAWAKEFESFVRDHRSQDPVSITIERVFQTQCSKCGYEWEEVLNEETGRYECNGCGREIEVVR